MFASIGCDPEVFVRDSGGDIVSAIGLVGGTKEAPKPVQRGAVQEDNMLAEFNIDPAYTVEHFVHNINTVISELEGILDGKTVEVKASHHFTKDAIQDGGRQALEFGCDPDFNCWTLKPNNKPSPFTTMRTAGGHVHIGYDNPSEVKSANIARMCEYYLGLPSVLIDNDSERRNLYGCSGAFRFKPYGLEYRVLSNFWIATDELKEWAFNEAQRCVADVALLPQLQEVLSQEELSRIINEGDRKAAEYYCEKLGILIP
jgi:hypothetical protein